MNSSFIAIPVVNDLTVAVIALIAATPILISYAVLMVVIGVGEEGGGGGNEEGSEGEGTYCR